MAITFQIGLVATAKYALMAKIDIFFLHHQKLNKERSACIVDY